MNELPHLALTIGDPAGIGPEITLKALLNPLVQSSCQITIFGSQKVLEDTYQDNRHSFNMLDPANLKIIDTPLKERITPGQGNQATGDASFKYLDSAIEQTLQGNFSGIVTNPISKLFWHMAGHKYPGQTEVLAQKAAINDYGMLFVAKSPNSNWIWRTLLATTHIPLAQVPSTLTPELISTKIRLLIKSLREDFAIDAPRIAIAGINPHSGEGGKLGSEEQNWLIPLLEKERSIHSSIEIIGPVAPDTLWINAGRAWLNQTGKSSAADAYLALYHDQGLIPVKLLAFDLAVNTTIGLPFVRTSPDHGTAFDIAGKGAAQSQSLEEAILLAAQLSQVRKTTLIKVLP